MIVTVKRNEEEVLVAHYEDLADDDLQLDDDLQAAEVDDLLDSAEVDDDRWIALLCVHMLILHR